MEGWEVSRDRIEKYQKMLSMDAVGDPIITSKCKLIINQVGNGFLVASHNGFAYRPYIGWMVKESGLVSSSWVRWHDVANIIQKKIGYVLVKVKLRKKGFLLTDKFGNPKIAKWRLKIRANKDEPRKSFKQRQQFFYNIMSELHTRNKGVTDPPTSDSRMVGKERRRQEFV